MSFCADLKQDETWGTFTSASPSIDSPENPFGDDNFVAQVPLGQQMRQDPLTPSDWASEFDREFSSGGAASTSTAEDPPAIVVPNLDEVDEPSTPGSTWRFTGEDEGEDLPPTSSPMIPEEPPLFAHSTSPTLPSIPLPRDAGPFTKPESSPAPVRSPASRSIDLPRPTNHQQHSPQYGVAISPPDPALIAAATEESPLGPGVTSNTHITSQGMLEKDVEGKKITVPADEIVRGVEGAIDRRE